MRESSNENYFAILYLPPKFDIDLSDLDKAYFTMQVQFHPDKATDEQKVYFSNMTMKVNQAYENIRDEFKRAKELLKIGGIDFDKKADGKILDPDFLQEVFDESQQISDMTSTDELSSKLTAKHLQKKTIVDWLTAAFASGNLSEALRQAVALRYVDNMIAAVKNKLQLVSLK
jgi:molecular chaperone HscB